MEILRRAATLTAQREEEAYRQIVPGKTRFAWKLPTPGETKTLSVEEMALVTEAGAEYLIPPHEELILILIPPRANRCLFDDGEGAFQEICAWCVTGSMCTFAGTGVSGHRRALRGLPGSRPGLHALSRRPRPSGQAWPPLSAR